MSHQDDLNDQRRQFLNWLAASPLFALGLGQDVTAQETKELVRNLFLCESSFSGKVLSKR